ncbi:RNA polymerase sigma factor [Patescibacteria group bacterium]|nr:RNA polymerase sigma factor [Patescibacteria group bacterium]
MDGSLVGTKEKDPGILMKLAKQGDEKAFSCIYELYFTPVFRYVYFRLKNKHEAEDLTQAVFIKFYESDSDFAERGKNPLAYFFTIARNVIIDHSRKKKEIVMGDRELEMEAGRTNEDRLKNIERKEICLKVKEALKRLTDDQQEIMILKFINDLSNKEIAAVLGKSEDTIRQVQSRAIRILRKEFENFNVI